MSERERVGWLGAFHIKGENMKSRQIIIIILILLCFLAGCSICRKLFLSYQPEKKNFPIFDALLYRGKPNLVKSFGLNKIQMVYADSIWPKGTEKMPVEPNETIVRKMARSLSSDYPVCIDIEHWKLTGDEAVVAENIRKYRQIIVWMREENPALKIGYYGILPVPEYWRVLRYKEALKRQSTQDSDSEKVAFVKLEAGYKIWQAENTRLQELSKCLDVIFPSLYTFYDNQNSWKEHAIAIIEEARIYKKPVYPFIWPQYHDGNTKLVGKYLPVDFWRCQLETLYKHADGVVIWGGYRCDWQLNFPWWKETIKFLKKIQRYQK
jgi:hypothetical protein